MANLPKRLAITREAISDEANALLGSTAWSSNYLTDDGKVPIATPTRLPRAGDDGSFFSQTLNTKTTIIACQTFHVSTSERPNDAETADMGEVHAICSLGTGLNGHDRIAHGGVLALLLDESMSNPVRLCPRFIVPSTFTKYLHVDYKRPLPLPGLILCRAWCTKMEERKMWVTATIEDGYGREYAVGKSLFVQLKARM